MAVAANLSSEDENDVNPQRDGVITPDRLHYSDTDTDDDMIPEQSEMIFRQFMSQRFTEENLPNNRFISQPQQQRMHNYSFQQQMPPGPGGGVGYSLSDELTRDLGIMSETFRRTGGRQEVAEQAANIDLSTLTKENLSLLLSQLFQDGVTPARLLVLFYFCSDLAVRAARAGLLHILTSVTSWSLAFVRGAVSAWVRIRGGWSRVLEALSPASEPDANNTSTSVSQTINQVAFASACAAVVGVCAIYMKKNL